MAEIAQLSSLLTGVSANVVMHVFYYTWCNYYWSGVV